MLISLAGIPAPTSASALFDSVEPLRLTLKAPLKDIARARAARPDYEPGRLRLHAATGAEREFDIRVRARGKNRREVCRFPPLRLAFDETQTAGTVFAGQDKLKLVTHCRPGGTYRQYLFQEYLAYRVLNELTDNSFRVRLANITYVDAEGRKKAFESPAFFIEDRDHMAARGNYEYKPVMAAGRHELDVEAMAIVELFQYLAGNTDWSVLTGPDGDTCCHNAILIGRPGQPYIPVPYDFDSTGIVDPPHAEPSEKLRLRSVRSRLYRGFCHAPGVIEGTVARFNDRRTAIYSLYDTQTELDTRARKKSLDYLDEFYEIVNDPRRLARNIIEECR